MQIWVAGVDEGLTPDGIITPGLGDSVSALLQPSENGVTILAHRETDFSTPLDESYDTLCASHYWNRFHRFMYSLYFTDHFVAMTIR